MAIFFIRKSRAGIALQQAFLALSMSIVASCASDNVHQPEPESIPDPQTFTGEITSSIPVFPTFAPITCDDYAVITWLDESQASAEIEIGDFSVDVSEMGMHIEIGTMTITDVSCMMNSDGSMLLSQPDFECQAGSYYTTGSLTGTLDGSSLSITLLYYPGSMPFQVESTFISQ